MQSPNDSPTLCSLNEKFEFTPRISNTSEVEENANPYEHKPMIEEIANPPEVEHKPMIEERKNALEAFMDKFLSDADGKPDVELLSYLCK